MNPRAAKEFLYSGDRFTADRALALGMVNQVVPRDELESTTLALAGRIAEMPRFGLALTKKAVNQAEDLQGMRAGMDSVFGLHHFAHAHNAETSEDSLGGLDAKSMAEKNKEKARVNLDFTPDELAFRDEARAWLAANVPAETLPSMDTADGFVAHQEWERRLADERWSVVSWPEEFGGRGASLVEWVIFEEEYYRAGAPGRVSQNGIFLLAPIIFDHGTDEQQQRWLPSMATGRADLGPGLVRARGRLRPRVAALDRQGGRRWLAAERAEDLVVPGGVRTPGVRPVPLRPRAGAAPRADLLLLPSRRRRPDRAADRPARRRGRLRRAVLRRRLRAGRRRARGARRRLERRDEHRRQRARPVAALARPLLRRGRPPARPVRRRARPGALVRPSSTPGSRPRPTASTPGARSPSSPTAATSARPAR